MITAINHRRGEPSHSSIVKGNQRNYLAINQTLLFETATGCRRGKEGEEQYIPRMILSIELVTFIKDTDQHSFLESLGNSIPLII